LSRAVVTIDGVLCWLIGFIARYMFIQLGITVNAALSLFYTISCSPLNTRTRFSAFTSRILPTDLSQSYCHFNSHMKSSWHSLILFLPFLLNHLRLQPPEVDQIQFLLDNFTSRLLFSFPSTNLLLLLLFLWRKIPVTILHGSHGRLRYLLSRMRLYCSVT
jgi:hypothetical protein